MAVRVRLRVKARRLNKALELAVLASGGAESPRPCLVVDTSTASELGLWPLQQAEVYKVEEASTLSEAYLLKDEVEIELLGEEGEVLSRVGADLAIQEGLSEPLITDVTIDSLGIQVVSFGKGLWRHVSDQPSKTRVSAQR